MGLRGPQPTPTALLTLTGSHHRCDRPGEPEVPFGVPDCPEWLSDGAKVRWAEMVERLRGMNLLSPNWRDSLAQYCDVSDQYERLAAACLKEEFVMFSDKGAPVKNPLFALKDSAFDRMLKLGREFGFTPASKTGLTVPDKPKAPQRTPLGRGVN